MCGRRHFVVFMVFFGMLITIGSREMFTMVTQHVISGNGALEGNIFKLKCMNSTGPGTLHRSWDHTYIMTFQVTYFVGSFLTTLPGGILAQRFSPRRISGGCIMASCVLFIVTRFDIRYYTSAWPIFLIRFVQGLIEGPIVPSLNGVIAAWAPKSEKSTLLTFAYAGAYLSSAVSAISSGLMICRVSWGSPLLLYGGAGVIWAALWLLFVYDTPATCPNLSDRERELFHLDGTHVKTASKAVLKSIPWRKILCSVPLSAIVVAAFCRNWVFSLLITQIPPYLKDAFHMDPADIGLWAAVPHAVMSVVVVCGGSLVDMMLKKHWISTTVARKAAETLGFGVEAGCMLALGFVRSKYNAVSLLAVGVGFSGFAISGYQVNPLDLAPQYSSILTAFARLGNIGSVISTSMPTVIPHHDIHKWQTVFQIAGSVHLAGVIYYLIFASGELQPWAIPAPREKVLPDVAAQPTESDRLIPNGNADVEVCEAETEKQSGFESWLTKSMHVERYESDESDDTDDIPAWYTNTI